MNSTCLPEMPRRAFLAIIAGGLLAAPLAAEAQPASKTARVGWLALGPNTGPSVAFFEAFREGLRERGWIDGRNLVIEARWGNRGQARDQAAELVQWKPDVLVAQGPMVFGARVVTGPIPVVFGFSGDPVEGKLVASLARPGGNLTGISLMQFELIGKRLEVLKEAVPGVTRVALLANTGHPGVQEELARSQAAARRLGFTAQYVPVAEVSDFEAAFEAMARERAEAIVVFPDAFIRARRPPSLTSPRAAASPQSPAGPSSPRLATCCHMVRTCMSHGARSRSTSTRSSRGQARRPARRAAHEVRAGHQPQDRQGPRPDDPAVAAAAGGSGDRVMDRRRLPRHLGGRCSSPRRSPSRRNSQGKCLGSASVEAGAPSAEPQSLEAFRQGCATWARSRARTSSSSTAGPRDGVDRLPDLAAELVRLQVDLIVPASTPGASGGQERRPRRSPSSSRALPIRSGRASSRASRGRAANLTGLSQSWTTSDSAGRGWQLLKEAVPKLARVAVLWNPTARASNTPASKNMQRSGYVARSAAPGLRGANGRASSRAPSRP